MSDFSSVSVSHFKTRQLQALDAPLRLAANTKWLFGGPPDAVGAWETQLKGFGEAVGPYFLADFGNCVGFFEVPHLGRIEVFSPKCGAAGFEKMLGDVMRAATSLPFVARASGGLPHDRGSHWEPEITFHAFAYLRHILSQNAAPTDALLPALQTILREPHRHFERTRENVTPDLARRVDGATLERLVAGRAPFQRATGARDPLSRALRGHWPLEISQTAVFTTPDTPENRFVKNFLGQIGAILNAVRRELAEKTDVFSNRLRSEADAMERLLQPIERAALWREVGPLTQIPASSTVLQKRRGYREVFRHFARLRLAAQVLPLDAGATRDLLEGKDIALLYELWAFFRLQEALEAQLGPPTRADRPRASAWEKSVPWELEIAWEGRARLLYNPRFSRGGPTSGDFSRRSYSLPLRPDFALWLADGPNRGLHLFDAKFRLDTSQITHDFEVEDEAAERRGSFQRGDLYKMHTYRDALPAARSVWALYPGDVLRFFHPDGVMNRWDEAPSQWEGVGALPLPLEGENQLDELLKRLLASQFSR